MAHRARVLFDEIFQSSDAVAYIRAMVDRQEPENDILEFKGMDKLELNDQAVKEYWSKALSGFTNTSGGVIIWGVDARKDPKTKIDGASALALCPNVKALTEVLKGCLLQATNDVVEKVQIHPITFEQSGGGVVVVWVGEGTNKPYRADLDKSRQYYMRVEDKFCMIPHALLRSLFYPRLSSKLEAVIKIDAAGKPLTFEFGIALTNKGTATARDVMIVIYTTGPVELSSMNTHGEWLTPNEGGKLADAFKFTAARAIHPAQGSYLAGFTWDFHRTNPVAKTEIGFFIRILALNQEADDVSAIFNEDDIFGKKMKIASPPDEPFDDPESPFYSMTVRNKGI
jgi:hypothetical protein